MTKREELIIAVFLINSFLAKAQSTWTKTCWLKEFETMLAVSLRTEETSLVCVLTFSSCLVKVLPPVRVCSFCSALRYPGPDWGESVDLSEIHPWGPLDFKSSFSRLVFPRPSAEASSLPSCHTQLAWLTRAIPEHMPDLLTSEKTGFGGEVEIGRRPLPSSGGAALYCTGSEAVVANSSDMEVTKMMRIMKAALCELQLSQKIVQIDIIPRDCHLQALRQCWLNEESIYCLKFGPVTFFFFLPFITLWARALLSF